MLRGVRPDRGAPPPETAPGLNKSKNTLKMILIIGVKSIEGLYKSHSSIIDYWSIPNLQFFRWNAVLDSQHVTGSSCKSCHQSQGAQECTCFWDQQISSLVLEEGHVSTHLLTHISTCIHTYTSYIYSYPPYIYAHTCCIPNIDPHTLIPPSATTLSAQMV